MQPVNEVSAVCTKTIQHDHQFNDIKTALSELVLTNKRSWFSYTLSQLCLRQARSAPDLDQFRKQVFVRSSVDASSQ